jgi:hypothetical protein
VPGIDASRRDLFVLDDHPARFALVRLEHEPAVRHVQDTIDRLLALQQRRLCVALDFLAGLQPFRRRR